MDKKRIQVYSWLKEQNQNIYFLQETHTTKDTEKIWENEWGYKAFFSGESSNSEGLAILINPNCKNINILEHKQIIPGRLQAIKAILDDKEFIFVNVYGPNKDSPNLFEDLQTYISLNDENVFIIGGDFNTVINDHIDRKGSNQIRNTKCKAVIKNIIETNELVDVWRVKNPDKRQFTWHSSQKPHSSSRLDYFLISSCILNKTKSVKITTGYKTDHSAVKLTIDTADVNRGPGYFKLNNSLLQDEKYLNMIKKSIKETAEINKDANPITLWGVMKGNIRNETIKYAAYIKKENNKKEEQLKESIQKLEMEITNSTDIRIIDEKKKHLFDEKTKLEKIVEKRIQGLIIRSKADLVEYDEKNTKYFAAKEKKRSEHKTITNINVRGMNITKQSDILNEIKQFYCKLYSKKQRQETNYNFFDDSIQKLEERDKIKCEGKLNDYECETALNEMKNDKSPGSNFIKRFGQK